MVHFLLSCLLSVPFLGNGCWKALSDTAVTTPSVQKTEVAQSGDNLYVAWYENADSENMQSICLRRSNNLGQTWEPVQTIVKVKSEGRGGNTNILAAAGDNVYVLSQQNENRISLWHSSDAGATFAETIVDTMNVWYFYTNSIVKAEGNDVLVAYKKERAHDGIYLAISHDAGVTFRDTIINEEVPRTSLHDLTYNHGRWSILHQQNDWYNGLRWGKVYVTTGQEWDFKTTKVSPTTESEAEKSIIWSIGSSNYHPLMCQVGDSIYVVFDGQVEDNIPRHTLYSCSADGGETWSDPVILPGKEENGSPKQVIARNGHVYVADINERGLVGVHSSHDNGETWMEHNALTSENGGAQFWGGTEDYTLQFDPNDPSGLSVYLVCVRLMWIYTNDGFESVSAANALGYYLIDTNGSTTLGHVLTDYQGHRHFFVNTIPDRAHDRQHIIYYHAEGRQPEPADEAALLLQKEQGRDCNPVLTITPEDDIRVDSAITVSLWVKIDSADYRSYDLAWHNVETRQLASNYNIGWTMRLQTWSNSTWYYEAALATDKSDDKCATRLYNRDQLTFIRAGKWHHLAFTYDARQGEDNLRAYMDGILVDKASLTGKLEWGFSPICIGMGDTDAKACIKYDDFCIWDCALSQEEIAQLPFAEIRPSNKVLHLNFNNTLADSQSHRYEAVAMNTLDFAPDPIHVPLADFHAVVEGKNATLIDKTTDGVARLWLFGDSRSDTLRHPQHNYSQVGDYSVQMIATNESAAWGVTKTVSLHGIERMEPSNGVGNAGYFYPTIYGGNLTTRLDEIFLYQSGILIPADSLLGQGNGYIRVRFNVEQASTGSWNLIMADDTLFNAVSLVQAQHQFLPTISLTGREKLLKDKWQSYTLTCGNPNNVSIYQVPVYIFIQDAKDLDVEFINFEMGEPDIEGMPQEYDDHLHDSIGDYALCKVWNKTQQDSVVMRLYPIILPMISPNAVEELRIRVKANEDVYVLAGISDGLLSEQGAYRISYEQWQQMHMSQAVRYQPRYIRRVEMQDMTSKGQCVMEYLGRGVISATAGAIPGLDCFVGTGFAMYDLKNDIQSNSKKVVSNALWNFGGTAVTCAASLMGPLTGFLAGALSGMICNYHTVKDCIGDVNSTEKNVRSVSSLDPNEMVGPAGAGEEHWIKPDEDMDYTIFFENKSTASAPAHTIAISDTLDMDVLDVSSFGFTSFAWADTSFMIEGQNVREFTRDVDLRPNKELIVRVSGKLDTVAGIADWTILSLNPQTLEEEEDPDLGVLPPNNEKGVGEGNVTFRIHQKESLASGMAVANSATIVFDANASIATNLFVNHIDATAPTSRVVTAQSVGDSVMLTFMGQDDESGVAAYEVWAQLNDTLVGIFDANYVGSTMMVPVLASKMGFWVIATDMVGWQEEKETVAEAVYFSTDCEELDYRQSCRIEKRIINGQLYILIDGKLFHTTGMRVE